MNLLELVDVTKSFGAVTAVDGLSFGVPDRMVFGLIGPNGAGKTTLMNIITGYARPDRGEIRLACERVDGVRPHRLARLGIARTYQNLRLYDERTVLENILVGRHLAFGGRPWRLWGTRRSEERAQHDVARQLAERLGLGSLTGTAVAGLSYGLRRRVEVARALALEPRLLLLDEPTAGMTRAESDEIGALVRAVNAEGVTVVLVDHNVRLVSAVCDQVAVLEWGRLIALGSPTEVWADEGVRRAYLGGARTSSSTGADRAGG